GGDLMRPLDGAAALCRQAGRDSLPIAEGQAGGCLRSPGGLRGGFGTDRLDEALFGGGVVGASASCGGSGGSGGGLSAIGGGAFATGRGGRDGGAGAGGGRVQDACRGRGAGDRGAAAAEGPAGPGGLGAGADDAGGAEHDVLPAAAAGAGGGYRSGRGPGGDT